ncbi:MAG: bifunctional 2-C-methyl-D-erythritol 4-phosphate cytidylyltransferase/2-C-methyl-D-erythritol 2,4-cyclodiphosphate synthase [Alphaproteobacteria bacterium]|nr:bifunctional 2-C-methyl-D-erythritol 4-phosphate cytidylyltransferase/2-C-methyl-D-erythritol 2,4-cyclodiphosphate synthase [Alphaproteobacteria bacterium]
MTGTIAVILAGGSGVRLGAALPKQYLAIGGETILRRTVEAFRRHPAIDGVQVVIRPEDRPHYDRATSGLDIRPPVAGGPTRQDSGRLGLEAVAPAGPDHVLIHDAARPFVDAGLIERVIDGLARYPAVIPAVAVADTLKRADGPGSPVGATVDRHGLWRAQTPQGFRFADILEAHRALVGQALTDDAAVAEAAGLAVGLVLGSEENFKVTTEDDLRRAERLVSGPAADIRTGTGFDVHRFGPGEHVTLCGVMVPHSAGLEGHSDADAGLHALTDAILGAIADGDIGVHFPPSDPKWRGAPSHLFLRHAAALVVARRGRISHVDVTLICEAPRIGPHRAAMTARIAEILAIDPGRVSIKATTTERLGFTGRGEGIAAQAVATVLLP